LLDQPDQNTQDSLQRRINRIRALSYLDPRINTENQLDQLLPFREQTGQELFKISRFPVTNLEFSRFVETGGYSRSELWHDSAQSWLRENDIQHPRYWRNYRLSWPNYPVVGVNIFEALAYCRWLTLQSEGVTFTLPSAEQWDMAAHGEDSDFRDLMTVLRFYANEDKLYYLVDTLLAGDSQEKHDAISETNLQQQLETFSELLSADISPDQIVGKIKEHMAPHRRQLEYGLMTPVGIFEPNELGCFDLFGNVWEWTRPESDEPSEAIIEQNYNLEVGDSIIVKGGSWSGSFNPIWNILGGWFDPYIRFHSLGFRVITEARSS